jgi:hypothetical protein
MHPEFEYWLKEQRYVPALSAEIWRIVYEHEITWLTWTWKGILKIHTQNLNNGS